MIRAPRIIKRIIEREGSLALVAAQQISKIFHGRLALRYEDPVEFTGLVSKLKGFCSEKDIILATTTRISGRRCPIPAPEGGSYLRHAANSIVYLRKSKGGRASAYIIKHPDRALAGRMVDFDEGGFLWAG